ncbi:MAG TPA: ester cyclase [Candidatus Eisenbacteria bacterium]|nr:ester cyclase [Candidatus Eisenbacteria bacterium]
MTAPREDRASLERIARRWIEEIWRPGDLGTFEELHAPEFRDRSAAGRGETRDDYRRMLESFYAAFPDFRTRIEDLVVDETRATVAIRWAARGTHRGPYLGVAPSGRALEFAGIEIVRVEGGRIVERWGEWDGMSLLAQLRLWTPPG